MKKTKLIDFARIKPPFVHLPLALALAALALVSVFQLPHLPVTLTVDRMIEVK